MKYLKKREREREGERSLGNLMVNGKVIIMTITLNYGHQYEEIDLNLAALHYFL